MTTEKEIEIHKEITSHIHEVFKSKRHDYGQTTETLLKKYGPASMLTFIYTKYERIHNLMMNGKLPKNESIKDTLLDLANYCIIWLLEIEKCESESKVCCAEPRF